MKYVRTQTNIFEVVDETDFTYRIVSKNRNKIYSRNKELGDKQANTIEELCDWLVIKYKHDKNEEDSKYFEMTDLLKNCKNIGITFREHIKWLFDNYKDRLEMCKLGIWTNSIGLVYVAKTNSKGEFELL